MAEIGAHVIKERLNKWAFLFLFSVLCLTAHETDDENKNTYVTVCTAVSIALSFLASVLHLGTTSLSAFFVSTVIEGLSSLILVALWGAPSPSSWTRRTDSRKCTWERMTKAKFMIINRLSPTPICTSRVGAPEYAQ